MSKVNIFTITDEVNYRGDMNNAIAVSKALHDALDRDLTTEFAFSTRLDNVVETLPGILAQIPSDENVIIVSAGETALAELAAIKGANITKVLSSHQYSNGIRAASADFDFVALPAYAVSPDEQAIIEAGTHFIPTFGVPHSLKREDVTAAYVARMQQDRKLSAAVRHCEIAAPEPKVIILAGDAPQTDGMMNYYGPDDAREFARHLAHEFHPKEQFLFITNGPRTGKFDEHGKPTGAHMDDAPLDKVSAAFLDELTQCGWREGTNYAFWDFRNAGPGKVDSAYQALLGLCAVADAEFIVPGESTSMVTEGLNILQKPITVYQAPSMNATHRAHMKLVGESGVATRWYSNGLIVRPGHDVNTVAYQPDAQRIVQAVLAARPA